MTNIQSQKLRERITKLLAIIENEIENEIESEIENK